MSQQPVLCPRCALHGIQREIPADQLAFCREVAVNPPVCEACSWGDEPQGQPEEPAEDPSPQEVVGTTKPARSNLSRDGRRQVGTALQIEARVEDQVLGGLLLPSGEVLVGRQLYRSPSGALRTMTGRPLNGWREWRFKGEDGRPQPIDALRTRSRGYHIPKPHRPTLERLTEEEADLRRRVLGATYRLGELRAALAEAQQALAQAREAEEATPAPHVDDTAPQ